MTTPRWAAVSLVLLFAGSGLLAGAGGSTVVAARHPTVVPPIASPTVQLPSTGASGVGGWAINVPATPALAQFGRTHALPLSTLSAREAAARAAGLPEASAVPGVAGSTATQLAPRIFHSGGAPLAPRPAGGSTTTNAFVSNSNCTEQSNVVQVGASNTSLLASAVDLQGIYNGSGGALCGSVAPSGYLTNHGLSAAFHSSDGGRTWTNTSIGLNKSAGTSSSKVYKTITGGDGNVVSSPSGYSLYATTYFGQCFFLGSQFDSTNCTSSGVDPSTYLNWGVEVARSANGGVTWSDPAVVSGAQAWKHYVGSGNCSGSVDYYANLTERPWLAYSPTGHIAVVGWDVLEFFFNNTACVAPYAIAAFLYVSVSSNDGVSWTVPKIVSGAGAETAQVVVGPAPKYPISVVSEDYVNASVSATTGQLSISLLFQNSSNNGATWSRAYDVGGSMIVHNAPDTSPDQMGMWSFESLATDNWSGSPHVGNLYIAWSDNQTGSDNGYPAIELTRSTNGGASFGAPLRITPGSHALTYFQPAVTVQPNGNVYVVYYGVNQTTGFYREYGVYSTDGGATWSSQFVISDSDSNPVPPFTGQASSNIGFNQGAVGTTAGVYAVWTDCRNLCGSPNYEKQLYAAQFLPVKIDSNANVVVTLQVSGIRSQIALPTTQAWEVGASVAVTAPPTAYDNTSYIWAFNGFTGLLTSSNEAIAFTYASGTTLTVNYVAVKAAWASGTFKPAVSTSKLTIDNFNVPLTSGSGLDTFNYTLAGGQTYYLNATANLYQPIIDQLITTTSGQTTALTINLPKAVGWIAGAIVPLAAASTAVLKVNGTVVPVNAATGFFNTSVGWGTYYVNATATGRTTFSTIAVVNPGRTTSVPVDLEGGWLNGVIKSNYVGIRVSVDNVALNSTQLTPPSFNVSLQGGTYTVTATAPGYNLSSQLAIVRPGQVTLVNVSLTNKGWIAGIVLPLAAVKNATLKVYNGSSGGYQTIAPTTGLFNVTVVGGRTWTVLVKSTGYTSFWGNYSISAGNGTTNGQITAQLTPLPSTGCTSNCPPPPNGGGTPSNGGISTLELAGIIIAIVAVAAIAAVVVIVRRRGGGGGSEPMAEEAPPAEEAYMETPQSDMPKLQSDGSFGPNRPQG
ncbi:MAG TPA: hypothetical protein VFF67_05500 [Thermoplasmata archaeon]|nr:hypothetical protein [Thermoplasmata archaeon]